MNRREVRKIKAPHIEIKTNNCRTEVFVDGEKLDGVRKVSFERKAGTAPILHIDLIATDMTIDAVMIPILPEVFRPFYESKKPSEDDSNV